jgi:signal transduction histidine kinase
MFDLLPDSPLTSARHRLISPMPDAVLFSLADTGLQGYEVEHAVPLSPALAERLRAKSVSGDTFHVSDASGEPWRLRRCGLGAGPGMWRFQSIDHSRCRLMERLRIALAPRLAAQVLHELRNPMNAMSLHADLLARTIPKTEDPVQRARAEASVQVIKTRLADLNQRQGTMVALWLALANPEGVGAVSGLTVAAIFENSLQLLRGLFALHNVVLRTENVDRITAGPDRTASQHLHLVLIALLAAACESASRMRSTTTEVLLQVVDGPEDSIMIELGPMVDSGELGLALGASGHVDALAGLALLLETEGMSLEEVEPAGTIRLTIPAVPILR